jgi:hypothetical protein
VAAKSDEIRLYLIREQEDEWQTTGRLEDRNGIEIAKTLELPWRNNERNISRIPGGIYPVIKHISPKFGQCFWLQDTGSRSQILIHAGNYHRDTHGCILVGEGLKDINNDGHLDVYNSRNTITKMLRALPRKFVLKITTIGKDEVRP